MVVIGLGSVVLAAGLLVAPTAFGGTLTGRAGSGVRPAAGLARPAPGGARPGARARGPRAGGLPQGGPLARFRNGTPLPFPRLGGAAGRAGGLGGRAGGGNNAGNNAGTGGNAGGCADVHIIATRASTEQPGAGIIGSLVSAVESSTDQSVSTDATDYPAVLNPYQQSVNAGIEALTEQMTTQAQNCPDSQMVLMGYSQGAQVIGDVLGGAAGGQGAPIDSATASKVSAVILMGDPTHTAGESFQAGTATNENGLFARGESQSLEGMAERIQSYCDTGDLFCAGGASIATHLGYTRKYNDQAEEFVLERIGG